MFSSRDDDLVAAIVARMVDAQRGLHSHLQQSSNPLCLEYRYERERRAADLSSDSDDEDHRIHQHAYSSARRVIAFRGDAFGSADDYDDDDLGQDVEMSIVEPVVGVGDFNNATAFAGDGDSEPEDELVEAEMVAELEAGWEPHREGAPTNHPDDSDVPTVGDRGDADAPMPVDAKAMEVDSDTSRRAVEKQLIDEGHGVKPKVVVRYSEKYPSLKPGATIQEPDKHRTADASYQAAIAGSDANPYAPFASRIDWEIARWAKLRGPGSTAFSELLSIKGVREALNLSYKTSDELNQIIDTQLPGRPKFTRREVVVQGEVMEFYSRDILECVRGLWGDSDFVDDLIFEPERHYADEDETIRVYGDMHTAKWWWKTQKKVENHTGKKSCTVVPIIISSDKTQLTQFRNKTAYPVYMTIGNLPKHIRRKPTRQGQVLLAYLPTSKLEHISNLASRRRTLANLFHGCMKHILHPLEKAGHDGVILTSGDGASRCCYPILAAYIGDYPEQVLVTLVKTGQCPVCPAPREGIGEPHNLLPPRSIEPVLEALNKIDEGPVAFTQACSDAGIKPIQDPFWKNLPFVNIYQSITPDLLHQLYQGFVKHVIGWIRSACGDSEIDARCRRLPPNHHIRLFMKGISHLSRVTGMEHDQICRFLLGLILDIRLPDGLSNVRLIRAVRALLDFLYLAKYPIHTSQTLDNLDDALRQFHENRDIFVALGIRLNFDIPKLHYAGHYRYFLEFFGTADNFNTEYTERLHIDMAKDAYAASNTKDEYPQMTSWLDRRERVMQHAKYLRRRLSPSAPSPLNVIKPVPASFLTAHCR
ncbi:hypothetical protein NLJ89_g8789 [Agrocybe chaxingu]|uniref:Uncharacterized protein n=1 Tax=Agrocybe chaxingu TaxID=84603 RepID=A0A9W8JTR1_9AGAR|nr:hypothetical protein NLJ89_g8789 [Agrocybe chaxingu]